MEKLLRSILEYSQAGVDETTPSARVDSNSALHLALSNLESTIRSAAAEIIAGSLPPVLAQEIPVSQIFQNLISNAIKYRSPERNPRIRISAEPDGQAHKFSVCDNGIGIDAQHKDRIFRIFKRLHGAQYPGTGIGLAICARIVERYGGKIWVDSEPGEGSCFQFTLPAAP
jgi:light-regulated signal transduction histidine kinase (bacteriophytochrome)